MSEEKVRKLRSADSVLRQKISAKMKRVVHLAFDCCDGSGDSGPPALLVREEADFKEWIMAEIEKARSQ